MTNEGYRIDFKFEDVPGKENWVDEFNILGSFIRRQDMIFSIISQLNSMLQYLPDTYISDINQYYNYIGVLNRANSSKQKKRRFI